MKHPSMFADKHTTPPPRDNRVEHIMTGTTWLRIRIVLIGVVFVASLFPPLDDLQTWRDLPQGMFPVMLVFILLGLALIPFGVVFVIAIQAVSPWSDAVWTRPTHRSNPLHLGNPLLFFHFGAYLVLAAAAGTMIAGIRHGWLVFAQGLLTLAAAAMIRLGVALCMRIFKTKFEPAPAPQNQHEASASASP